MKVPAKIVNKITARGFKYTGERHATPGKCGYVFERGPLELMIDILASNHESFAVTLSCHGVVVNQVDRRHLGTDSLEARVNEILYVLPV